VFVLYLVAYDLEDNLFLNWAECFITIFCAGRNADEMFEDIGHSSEARTKMKEYLIGTLAVSCVYYTAF
jgi:cytochrome b involved in lipid metabolism